MESPVIEDPYKALGVSKTATEAEIKKAYRKLVLTCHPDKITDEALKAQKTDEFHKIQTAYDLIGSDDARQRYEAECRLEELRKEKAQREDAGRTSSYSANTASYRTASGGARMYEERRPSFDTPSYFDAPSHGASKKYPNEAYPGSRRSPPRTPRTETVSEKERERARRSDREKARDQEEKRDREYKKSYVYDEEEEYERKKREYARERAERESSSRTKDSKDDFYKQSTRRSDPEVDLYSNLEAAQAHISRTKAEAVRPGVIRSSTGQYAEVRRSRASAPKVETRPSTRRTESSERYSERRPATLEKHNSSPAKMEIPERTSQLPRTQTMQPEREYRHMDDQPKLRRAETTPIQVSTSVPRAKESRPVRPSGLRHSESVAQHGDSGYSSTSGPNTPEAPVPRTTRYRYADEETREPASYSYANGRKTEVREPGQKSTSPPRERVKEFDRPPLRKTYAYTEHGTIPIVADAKRPGIVHTTSSRVVPNVIKVDARVVSPERRSDRDRYRERESERDRERDRDRENYRARERYDDRERSRDYDRQREPLYGEYKPSDKYSSSRSARPDLPRESSYSSVNSRKAYTRDDVNSYDKDRYDGFKPTLGRSQTFAAYGKA